MRPEFETKPVYDGYFADPDVWQAGGEYYAIGTGETEAAGETLARGRVFPLLRSKDFFHWQFAGHALERPDPALGNNYWAPEVAFANGQFYLYYSVGFGDKAHQLRVASSDQPLGPYRDYGQVLAGPTAHPFAIDPDPFQDADGQWYLFYARDFWDCAGGARAGTALVVDRLKSMTELAGEETVVLRAHYDWQRFQDKRLMYGNIWDWHTLEGPYVRRHGGKYYCFFSGGRWETDTYGVDYATATQVIGPYSDDGGADGARVLRTQPGKLIGPGHNSLITGPDGRTDYIVYHAWDAGMKARRMHVSELFWTPQGPRCRGF